MEPMAVVAAGAVDVGDVEVNKENTAAELIRS